MKLSIGAVLLIINQSCNVSAFTGVNTNTFKVTRKLVISNGMMDDDIEEAIQRQGVGYSAGKADSDLARRYGNLAGTKIKTVSDAFADFTVKLGHPINALYKSAINDLVGTTHLIKVTARFKRDPIWSLGLMSSLDLILKNYPEKDIAAGIRQSLVDCNDMDLPELQAEAQSVLDWAKGKSVEEIGKALSGEGDSVVAVASKAAKADDLWMYSKWYGIGLVKLMDVVGVEQSKESCYPVMENWMGTSMGKAFYTACNDSDQYFATKSKLDMIETLMKEVEIREKKKMAQRLEDKADRALAAAERDEKFKLEAKAEETEKAEEGDKTEAATPAE